MDTGGSLLRVHHIPIVTLQKVAPHTPLLYYLTVIKTDITVQFLTNSNKYDINSLNIKIDKPTTSKTDDILHLQTVDLHITIMAFEYNVY